MRCPCCGFDNDEGQIFCEECDWKLSVPYKRKMNLNPFHICLISLLAGVISIAGAFLGVGLVGIIAGAIGMFLCGYTQSLIRLVETEKDKVKTVLLIASVGLILSVIGFIYGLYVTFL